MRRSLERRLSTGQRRAGGRPRGRDRVTLSWCAKLEETSDHVVGILPDDRRGRLEIGARALAEQVVLTGGHVRRARRGVTQTKPSKNPQVPPDVICLNSTSTNWCRSVPMNSVDAPAAPDTVDLAIAGPLVRRFRLPGIQRTRRSRSLLAEVGAPGSTARDQADAPARRARRRLAAELSSLTGEWLKLDGFRQVRRGDDLVKDLTSGRLARVQDFVEELRRSTRLVADVRQSMSGSGRRCPGVAYRVAARRIRLKLSTTWKATMSCTTKWLEGRWWCRATRRKEETLEEEIGVEATVGYVPRGGLPGRSRPRLVTKQYAPNCRGTHRRISV